MALIVEAPIKVLRLKRFGLTTHDPAQLTAFYQQAFGCRGFDQQRLSGHEFERLMGVKGGADSTVMMLGDEVIELLAFDEPGMPYPPVSSADDPIFQHFAIVVDRMDQAYGRLSAVKGWKPISTDGPQQLPKTSGGVIAFKFRDPDGHPLELLQFPKDLIPPRWRDAQPPESCLGIDHSAITVRDTDVSVAFYADLGFVLASRSLNQGAEQNRLDGLAEAVVDVLALAPPRPTPHVELLSYRGVSPLREIPGRASDVASVRLTFEAAPRVMGLCRSIMRTDPDGHHLVMEAPDPA